VSVNAPDRPPAIVGLVMVLGGAILTFFFLLVAIAEAGWLVKAPISGFVLPLAFAGSCLATAWATRMYFRRPLLATLAVVAILALLVAASARISLAFYDVSFDGQAYQQEGVYQLAHGWNPLVTPYISPVSIDQDVKLIHYPKGPWIAGAAMYRLTGRIETGKFANIPLLVAAFCLALAVFAGLDKKLSMWSAAMALLAAANPVAVCQILSFYVDGQMASLLAGLAALCFLSVTEGGPWVNLLLFEAAVLLIEWKFTGLVYVTLFFAGFVVLLLWRKRPWRKFACVALVALGLGTFVFGRNPYVSNIFENGHPFYPFLGQGDFPRITMDATTPPEFLHANRVANLAASIFSRSKEWPPQSQLKAPWQVDRSEWAAFEEPDALVGGFGPLFPAALVLSLALLAIGMRHGGTAPRVALILILVIIASVLPVSACWWARYAPQVWLIPVLALAPFAGAGEKQNLRRASWLILLILSANVAGIAAVNLRANLKATREVAESLDDLRTHAPFKVAFGYFHSNRFRLQEAGIPFTEQEGHLNCDPQVKENDDLCIER
jgi:hypothetical protein